MLGFEKRAKDLDSHSDSKKIIYILLNYYMWNRVTTGRIDHKINTKSNLVDFDAILSIVSAAADAK